MGRVVLGIGLAFIAIAMAIAGAISIYLPLLSTCSLSERHALALSFYDGRIRLFYFRSLAEPIRPQPVYAQLPAGQGRRFPIVGAGILPRIRVSRLPLPEVLASDDPSLNAWRQRRQPHEVRLGNRREVSDFGGRWRGNMSFDFFPIAGRPPAGEFSYFRVPVWLPVALLILFPVRMMLLGPWRERRRRKRNQCIACGYDLHGLTAPRCPECGAAVVLADRGDRAVPT